MQKLVGLVILATSLGCVESKADNVEKIMSTPCNQISRQVVGELPNAIGISKDDWGTEENVAVSDRIGQCSSTRSWADTDSLRTTFYSVMIRDPAVDAARGEDPKSDLRLMMFKQSLDQLRDDYPPANEMDREARVAKLEESWGEIQKVSSGLSSTELKSVTSEYNTLKSKLDRTYEEPHSGSGCMSVKYGPGLNEVRASCPPLCNQLRNINPQHIMKDDFDRYFNKPEDQWTDQDIQNLHSTFIGCRSPTPPDPFQPMLSDTNFPLFADKVADVARQIRDSAKKEAVAIQSFSMECQSLLSKLEHGNEAFSPIQQRLFEVDNLIQAGAQGEACTKMNDVVDDVEKFRQTAMDCREQAQSVKSQKYSPGLMLALAGAYNKLKLEIEDYEQKQNCN